MRGKKVKALRRVIRRDPHLALAKAGKSAQAQRAVRRAITTSNDAHKAAAKAQQEAATEAQQQASMLHVTGQPIFQQLSED